MKELLVVDLGLVEYGAAWELQRRVAAARKAGAMPDVLLLCEHPHVITLGRSGKISNLLASEQMLRQMGVSFLKPVAAAISPITGRDSWSAIPS